MSEQRKARPGYRWERREGCSCKFCPWKGNCRGETWPHWIEVALTDEKGREYEPRMNPVDDAEFGMKP